MNQLKTLKDFEIIPINDQLDLHIKPGEYSVTVKPPGNPGVKLGIMRQGRVICIDMEKIRALKFAWGQQVQKEMMAYFDQFDQFEDLPL